MINLQQATLTKLVTHQIGDKTLNGGIRFSKSYQMIDDEKLTQSLLSFFTKNYKEPEFFEFTFTSGEVMLNPLYNYVANVFDNPDILYEESVKMARLLYEKSDHHNIKPGELYIAHLRDLLIDDEMVEALAIVKAEDKETFLNINEMMNIEYHAGTPVNKIDKACLILNTERNSGFKILNIDHSNKNRDARYWRDDFLFIAPKSTNYNNTTEFIKLTSGFIKQRITNDANLTKMDEVDFMNKTLKYVRENQKVSMNDYKENVLQSKTVIDGFESFEEEIAAKRSRTISEEFEVSDQAIKKFGKVYKSIIKLDKNFHIYVHGDRSKIVKGVDENGRKFYAIYYDEEH